jgi:heptosyltransferase II
MILFIQTAFLGDLLLSIPILKRIREVYPAKKIHLLCRKNLGSLLLENNIVDVVHDSFQSTKPSLREVQRTFKNQKFDLIVCPHESLRSSLICALISAENKIGFYHFYDQWIFKQSLPRPRQYPEALRQLSLLTLIDPATDQNFQELIENQAPFSQIPTWASMQIRAYQNVENRNKWKEEFYFSDDKKVICLAPGSVWPTKQWGGEKYSALAQRFVKKGMHVVLIGAPQESHLAEQIVSDCPQVQNEVGKTSLSKLAKIIACSDLLVCNDSGAMHVAAMTGTSVVSIFGPTVQKLGYQPWTQLSDVIENNELTCRPCSTHGGKRCPLGTHECMKSLDVELVEGRVYRKLQMF